MFISHSLDMTEIKKKMLKLSKKMYYLVTFCGCHTIFHTVLFSQYMTILLSSNSLYLLTTFWRVPSWWYLFGSCLVLMLGYKYFASFSKQGIKLTVKLVQSATCKGNIRPQPTREVRDRHLKDKNKYREWNAHPRFRLKIVWCVWGPEKTPSQAPQQSIF